MPVDMLVDTGATVSLVDKKVFDLVRSGRALQKVKRRLIAANGESLKVYGEARLKFMLQGHLVKHDVIVCDLPGAEAIMGIDLIEDLGGVLDVANGTLHAKSLGVTLRLHRAGVSKCSKVALVDTSIIPPRSEVILAGRKIGGRWNENEKLGLVEPTTQLPENGQILVAKALVNAERDCVPLRVANLTSEPVVLRRGTVAGLLKPVEEVCEETHETGVRQETPIAGAVVPEHLKSMVEDAHEALNDSQREQVSALVCRWAHVFAKPDGKLGKTPLVEHRIDTGDAPPIKQRPRRQAWAKREVIDREVEKMLEADVIEPCSGPWASPIVIVTKKDGTPRVCIYFRKVNNVTRKDAFPLPRMDDCLDALAGSKLFSTLDLASGYWQIPVAEEDRDKTAFNTRNGLHRFRVMPFGLATAPATFERLMELVLKGLTFDRCLVYLDDVIVFGRTFEEALQNLDRVFERIEQASLLLKPSKCRLFKTSVDFLGHVVSADGISCDPKKISAVQNWAAPSSVKEVRSFVGFASYYRKFIPGFATVAGPLHALMGKVKFEWSNACQEAFDKLKSLLMSTPVLAYPQEGQTFYLDTDASNVGTGAVLSQVNDGSEHPVAHASRALSTSQRNYCTTMRELLAVVQYTNHFLLGNKFILRTDHASLVWLTNFKEPEGMLARWLAALAVFDFEIQHRPGKKHGNADGLSRRKCARSQCPDCRPTSDDEIAAHLSETGPSNESENRPKVDEHSELDDIDREQSEPGSWLQGWTLMELKAAQDEDKNIAKFTAWKLSRLPRPERAAAGICGREGLWFYAYYDMLEVHNGLLYVADTKREVKSSTVLRLVAPLPIRRQLFKQIHQTRTGGHQGINNTIAVVNCHFYWPGQYADVRRWCQQCEGCARAKTGESGHRAKLVQDIPGMPMERMAVDLMGPLPKTENGNLYIAVVVDYFTKWAEAFALPNKQSQTVAEALVTGVICRLGAPHRLHSDQGGEFESNLWAEVCELLDVEKTRTSPYRPQSDGLVERLNRTIKKMLKVFVNDNRDDWDDHLPYIMMAYRATPQASTQCSPNLLMYGREVNLPVEVMAPPPPSQAFTCPNEYVEWVRAVLEQAFQFARHHLAASAERQKRCYDNRSNPCNFQAGHWVWYLYKPYCRLKFKCPWIGPCLVLRQLGRVNVEIQASPEDKPKVVHVDYLKPYWAEDKVPERWVPLPEKATREWPPEDPGAWDEDPDSAEKEDEAPRPASPEAEEPVEAEDEIAPPLKDVRPEARRRVRKPARYQDYVMT